MAPNHTYAFGKKAIKYAEALGVSAKPKHYELLYAFIRASHDGLVEELKKKLKEASKLTDDDMEDLYNRYLSDVKLVKVAEDSGGKLSEIIHQTISRLGSSLQTTTGYGKSLENACQSLADDPDRSGVQALVKTLQAATEKMQAENRTISEDLRASRDRIQELTQNLEAARAETVTDALTGLGNRKRFDETMHVTALEVAKGRACCLVVMDVDHFKKFNDTHGHQAGDQVLRLVGVTVRQSVAEGMVPCRYGGEEFAIIMPGLSLSAARTYAERIRESLQKRELIKRASSERLGRVTISSGIARWLPSDSTESVLARADEALYEAKARGRNQTITDEENATSASIA